MIVCTALIAAGAHPEQEGTLDVTALSLSGVYFAQAVAVLVAVAVVSAEYPRMMRTTLAANPRRGTVFTAKTLLAAGAVGVLALPGVTGALLTGRAVLTGGAARLPLSSWPLWRATLGTAVYLLLVALLTTGIALIVRHAAAAVGTALTLLYGPYLATLIIEMPDHALHLVQKISPMTAGLAVQTVGGAGGTSPWSPGAGLAVTAVYAAGALVAGWGMLRWRDA
ncbi:hypothetical protein J3486_20265 [Streptomyces sp. VRA16 Mangrove soil]|nr:hypothetical protein [Streptomyces sp. VRA16 Mangrove soil]